MLLCKALALTLPTAREAQARRLEICGFKYCLIGSSCHCSDAHRTMPTISVERDVFFEALGIKYSKFLENLIGNYLYAWLFSTPRPIMFMFVCLRPAVSSAWCLLINGEY